MTQNSPLRHLSDRYRSGQISRRAFVEGSAKLGIGAAVTSFLATSLSGSLVAQEATPVASTSRPATGTESQERGEGGELNIIQWQAPTSLSPHVVGGTKDWLGSLPVMEPLMHYGIEAELIPNLVAEVPSKDNGGLNDDLTVITFRLLPDVTWSDGEPFTSADVEFTVDWVKNPDNAAVSQSTYALIDHTEIVDDLTIEIHFATPNPFWPSAFTGTSMGFVYPKHILDGGDHDAFISKPIGTGPYKVDSFSPNDSVQYSINENYREPNKPYFSSISLKGGGDAPAAARAVIQTGEFDYAWNMQVEPDILSAIESEGESTGYVLPYPGVAPEKMNINFSDPNTEHEEQRSHKDIPHPILSDHAVRGAIATGINRQLIADQFYGYGQQPNSNLIVGSPEIESPNTTLVYDPDAAAQMLEDAGWVMDGDVRKKDDVELSLVFATSINSVRQKTQSVVKSNLEEIGFKIELLQVDAGIFFDSAAGNEQNATHFYWDLSEQQNNPDGPRPIEYMELFYAGPDGENIAQKSNSWNKSNWIRYNNPEYDAALEAARAETDEVRLAELFIEMNDILINDHAVIPLVIRGSNAAIGHRINAENVAPAPFSYDYWNIANWNEAN